MAFVLYILFISMASAHHLLVDPGMGPSWKVVNTSYFMYMAVLASMVHGFTVPAGMEMGQRLRGFTRGMFDWLRRAPWGDPGFSGLVVSVVLFGFIGGITGVPIGTADQHHRPQHPAVPGTRHGGGGDGDGLHGGHLLPDPDGVPEAGGVLGMAGSSRTSSRSG
jgi:cytochrome c oxidase subunit 1